MKLFFLKDFVLVQGTTYYIQSTSYSGHEVDICKLINDVTNVF